MPKKLACNCEDQGAWIASWYCDIHARKFKNAITEDVPAPPGTSQDPRLWERPLKVYIYIKANGPTFARPYSWSKPAMAIEAPVGSRMVDEQGYRSLEVPLGNGNRHRVDARMAMRWARDGEMGFRLLESLLTTEVVR